MKSFFVLVFRIDFSLERSRKVDRQSDGPDQRVELPSRLQQEVRNIGRAGRRLHPHRHPESIGLKTIGFFVVECYLFSLRSL